MTDSRRTPLSEELKNDIRRVHAEADAAFSFSVLLLELSNRLDNLSQAVRLGMMESDEARAATDTAIAQYLYRMRSR